MPVPLRLRRRPRPERVPCAVSRRRSQLRSGACGPQRAGGVWFRRGRGSRDGEPSPGLV